MNDLAIIIPTYKERENLEILLPELTLLYPESMILVVNDDSGDDTERFVNKFFRKNKKVKLINRKIKGGRGSAVVAGIREVIDNYPEISKVVEMDADFSHPPAQIKQMYLKSKDDNTVVIASRYMWGSKVLGCSTSRRLISKTSNFYIRRKLKLNLSDATNGFRCYPKEAMELIASYRFRTTSFIVLSEIAKLLNESDFEFVEVPTVFEYRKIGTSNAGIKEFVESAKGLRKIS